MGTDDAHKTFMDFGALPAMSTYVSLADAKAQLSIDDSLTIHDRRISLLIGAAEDWAENFTQRSLAELMTLDSPTDSGVTAVPDPKDSPIVGGDGPLWNSLYAAPSWLNSPQAQWTAQNWQYYWGNWNTGNPVATDHSRPLRRDVYSAILLWLETLFDRNTDNTELLQNQAMAMLMPYRQALGV